MLAMKVKRCRGERAAFWRITHLWRHELLLSIRLRVVVGGDGPPASDRRLWRRGVTQRVDEVLQDHHAGALGPAAVVNKVDVQRRGGEKLAARVTDAVGAKLPASRAHRGNLVRSSPFNIQGAVMSEKWAI